jgi:HAD superfamily hydrolase (TIGR01509 family)
VFDLGKVLIDFDVARACDQIAEISALPFTSIKKFLFDDGLEMNFEAGAFNFSSLHQQFEEHFKITVSRSDLAYAAANIFTPMPATIDFLQALRHKYRAHLPFVLLSNTNEIHWEFIERHWKISQWFDYLILSFEIKAMKPDPVIFREVRRVTGVPAQQCFFVDDLTANVDAARREGFDAEAFVGIDQLRQHLFSRGISV